MKTYLLIADKYSNLAYWQTIINVASNCEIHGMLLEDFPKDKLKLHGWDVAFVLGNNSQEDSNELKSVFEYLVNYQIPMYLNPSAHDLYEQLNMTNTLVKGVFDCEMSILEFAKMLEQKDKKIS